MLSMSDQIDRFEKIRVLSSEMVNAARSNGWERLIALERGVAALRDELLANEADLGPDAATGAAEIDRMRDLIQQVLEDDAQIRRHTEPWMEHVRQFLCSQNRRKQVQLAYTATDSTPGGF